MDHYAQVEQTVKEILAKQLKIDTANIKPEVLLAEDLRMDSFGALETAFELEDKFAIQIPNEVLFNVKTVKDIVDYIAEQTQGKANT
ncbi:MAG: acyl carrier protein [Verrucomicrobia bacterium]|nr:MAG: acyl carrier protein [Verrucomicrobiota bacterium]